MKLLTNDISSVLFFLHLICYGTYTLPEFRAVLSRLLEVKSETNIIHFAPDKLQRFLYLYLYLFFIVPACGFFWKM